MNLRTSTQTALTHAARIINTSPRAETRQRFGHLATDLVCHSTLAMRRGTPSSRINENNARTALVSALRSYTGERT